MSSLLAKIQDNARRGVKALPVFFVRSVWAILLGGVLAATLLGLFIFYQNSYLVVQDTYEAFVSVKRINKTLYQKALDFIEIQQTPENSRIPSENPFVK